MRPTLAALALAGITACGLPSPGAAAAPPPSLVEAAPSADSVAQGVPSVVELTFSEAVQPGSSGIRVKADGGRRVDRGRAYSVGDARHLAIGIKTLPPGHYRVDWRATAAGAHAIAGSYGFTVAP